MKRFFLGLGLILSLSACPDPAVIGGPETPGGGVPPAVTLAGAIAAETGIRLRCPRNVIEWSVLTSVRLTIDLTVAVRWPESDRQILAGVRAETDRVCRFVPIQPIPTVPPPLPPASEPVPLGELGR